MDKFVSITKKEFNNFKGHPIKLSGDTFFASKDPRFSCLITIEDTEKTVYLGMERIGGQS